MKNEFFYLVLIVIFLLIAGAILLNKTKYYSAFSFSVGRGYMTDTDTKHKSYYGKHFNGYNSDVNSNSDANSSFNKNVGGMKGIKVDSSNVDLESGSNSDINIDGKKHNYSASTVASQPLKRRLRTNSRNSKGKLMDKN